MEEVALVVAGEGPEVAEDLAGAVGREVVALAAHLLGREVMAVKGLRQQAPVFGEMQQHPHLSRKMMVRFVIFSPHLDFIISLYLYSEIFDFDEPTLAPQPRSIPATRPTPSAATPLRPAPPPPTRTRAQPLPTASTGSVEVKCRCNMPAGERTVVKEGPNKGRRFWTCSNSGQCDFFEWMDGPSSGSSLLRDASLKTAPKKMPIGRAVRI